MQTSGLKETKIKLRDAPPKSWQYFESSWQTPGAYVPAIGSAWQNFRKFWDSSSFQSSGNFWKVAKVVKVDSGVFLMQHHLFACRLVTANERREGEGDSDIQYPSLSYVLCSSRLK